MSSMNQEDYLIIARIRDNKTGEIREHSDGLTGRDCEDGRFNEWWWSDGNASCDCNRGLFFNDEDHECGDTAYSVEILKADTKEVLYSEFE